MTPKTEKPKYREFFLNASVDDTQRCHVNISESANNFSTNVFNFRGKLIEYSAVTELEQRVDRAEAREKQRSDSLELHIKLLNEAQEKIKSLESENSRLKMRDELFETLMVNIAAKFGGDGGLAKFQDGVYELEAENQKLKKDGEEYQAMAESLFFERTKAEDENKELSEALAGNICGYCWNKMEAEPTVKMTQTEFMNQLVLENQTLAAKLKVAVEQRDANASGYFESLDHLNILLQQQNEELAKVGEK